MLTRPLRLVLVLAALTGACTPIGMSSTPEGPIVSSLLVRTGPDSVQFTYQVTNVSDQPVTLTFPSAQRFDVRVTQDGREIWRWSADRMFAQMLGEERLDADETRQYTAVWPAPGDATGEMTAVAFLTAQEHRAEQQARFELP